MRLRMGIGRATIEVLVLVRRMGVTLGWSGSTLFKCADLEAKVAVEEDWRKDKEHQGARRDNWVPLLAPSKDTQTGDWKYG